MTLNRKLTLVQDPDTKVWHVTGYDVPPKVVNTFETKLNAALSTVCLDIDEEGYETDRMMTLLDVKVPPLDDNTTDEEWNEYTVNQGAVLYLMLQAELLGFSDEEIKRAKQIKEANS